METESTIELVIEPRVVPLIGGMTVRRILPFRSRRQVGPFVFLDEMGPFRVEPGGAGDVPQHPHIGLETVTYLFEGALDHRDSLGTLQRILPGEVNWMTAGDGIAHSEQVPLELRERRESLHGLQAWVALPVSDEEGPSSFAHHGRSEIPRFEVEGARIELVAGRAFGRESPVRTRSRLFYFMAELARGRSLAFDSDGQEAGVYLLAGRARIEGREFAAPALVVFKRGATARIEASEEARLAVFGGDPHPEPRRIWWNFVSSSQEKIDRAKKRWRERDFPMVPGESSYVPLPPA